MAGSVATLAVLWISLQTMGFLGHSHSIGAYKLPISVQRYLTTYTGLPLTDDRDRIVIDTDTINNRRLPQIDEKVLNASINFGQMILSRMSRLEENIAAAGIGLLAGTPVHSQYVNSYPSKDALEKGFDALVVAKASVYLAQNHCQRFGFDDKQCAHFVSTLKLHGTPLGPSCIAEQDIFCNPRSLYRSADGTCNNLENPRWGSALTAYARVLFPQYSDGKFFLRRRIFFFFLLQFLTRALVSSIFLTIL